ncbi:23 kDa integral membrane protein-like [Rhynchophorus ferrugineus]|uniref:Tetraspanin n=1 Tax=Rhynchophorus ferrugineus TaxID=354439 RepID=A0A834IFS3_RHYFE|nr:hypothetical protein GWI33_014083 [Rhynchophorus ferrugineus]
MGCSKILRDYTRYILILFNFFFVLTGTIIISVGISVKAYFNEFDDFLDKKYFYLSDLIIIIGIIIFIIAFVGCCGALKENACLTSTFSTLLIIIFVLEGIAGICGSLLKNRTEQFLEENLKHSMALYNNDTEITKTWDLVQTQFHCCGTFNYTDWQNSSLPISCCHIPSGTKSNFSCSTDSVSLYKNGCLEKFGYFVSRNISKVEIVGITLALIQLLGILLSCYLAKQIRSDYETV